MNKRLLGVIDATTVHEDLHELALHRSAAAIPFGGRYRLIDFILSNMVNSGIQSVAIFPEFQYRSLMDHLGSGKNWDLNRKRDGLFFFPTSNPDKPYPGIGTLDHFADNIDFFERSTQDFAVIANSYTVFNMDFQPLLDWHIKSGCDITEVHKNGATLGIYLVKKTLLMDLITTRNETGYSNMRDVVTDIDSQFKLCYYDFEGYAVMVDTIAKYFNVSMDLLKPEVWKELFPKERPILTKVKDEPPTRYETEASVRNTMVANGGLIEGTVENSIIARGVKIGKGTVIRNCIIMQKTQIKENCILESVIVDKDARIEAGTVITAPAESPAVIRKGTVQGMRTGS
ncbi:sugar phosphate nucleotidyltransferase [Mesobacillus subterraneus]|uniref:sugar phosphate nucleotidyltransferase n=1 Tax=Mesobacillus subterraneus TaxID=285983 RepID=UPI002041EBF9|nr:sugar phosphate nucleotidyltransferase [Mesobacillus subterraneus]MCM3667269.1 sugar phosphate nucleotidyltransferase [Mesobacillus subterraneus]MCM3686238.1 sugar phosphate nucleotidyltransferase [Mesobacillus subterraneus]